jgi:cytochrome o ubiquinol oxidase subunit II
MIERPFAAAARFAALCGMTMLGGCSARMPLLDPAGPIGEAEKSTILTAIGLMLIVAIPVFAMTFLFAWRYRASNKQAAYAPDWSHSRAIEIVVWAVPALIVLALGNLAWGTTHRLSPYRPIASTVAPINVDVVAMNWKWLFIYPQQHIATLNELVIPAHVPVSFRLTSETVTASFFIPSLGSQIYAMPGMQTKLHLVAARQGRFVGQNNQFSGRGYSSMRFDTVVTSDAGFKAWVNQARSSPDKLDPAALHRLEQPSTGNPPTLYSSVSPGLFDRIIDATMTAGTTQPASNA